MAGTIDGRGNSNSIVQEFEEASAEGLLRAAIYLQSQLRQRLSAKTNPPPHKTPSAPGEYPALRTGFGRDNVLYEPTSPQEVAREGAVRVGWGQNAFYMAILELHRARLGVLKAVEELTPQLEVLACG